MAVCMDSDFSTTKGTGFVLNNKTAIAIFVDLALLPVFGQVQFFFWILFCRLSPVVALIKVFCVLFRSAQVLFRIELFLFRSTWV
jgi:hypothetical protein